MTPKPYRKNVAGLFIDEEWNVMAVERGDMPGFWQFPQGGVDDGETDEQAVLREMSEELGVNETGIEIIGRLPRTVKYDFPPEIAAVKPYLAKFAGQEQTIFILRFKRGAPPNLKAADGELSDYKFVRIDEIPPLVVGFKRKAAEEIAKMFAEFAALKRG